MTRQTYMIALGSNQRVPGIGSPRTVIGATINALSNDGWKIEAVSSIIESAPVGPSSRRYANACALIGGDLDPADTLALLQEVERAFGRERRGQRWRARPLDLDIILWSGGVWASEALTIPHPLFRERRFVLRPACEIAPLWRDPVTGLTVRQLAARVS